MHALPVSFVIRRLVLIALVCLPQGFWLGNGWRLAARSRYPWLRRLSRFFLVVVALAILLVLYDRISHKFLPAQPTNWIAPALQLWVFTSTLAFFAVKTVHAIEWMWSRWTRTEIGGESGVGPDRRAFFRYAAWAVGALPFLPAIYGFTRERFRFGIVPVDVPIPDLPAALDGLRIVQLSDIHAGDFMPPEEVRRAVRIANSMAPDLAVITGDFVSSKGDPLAECIAELSQLKAALGVWGCNGNHEIYAGAEEDAEALFEHHGMKLLRQTAAQLNWHGTALNLIGIDYQRDLHLTGSQSPTLQAIAPLVRPDMLNILLSHNPNSFPPAAALGIELTLAGHTHGGQVNLEIVNHAWNLARFITPFTAGLYELPMSRTGQAAERLAHLYVNRGLGTLGVPARLGAEPEITLLTLHSVRSNELNGLARTGLPVETAHSVEI